MFEKENYDTLSAVASAYGEGSEEYKRALALTQQVAGTRWNNPQEMQERGRPLLEQLSQIRVEAEKIREQTSRSTALGHTGMEIYNRYLAAPEGLTKGGYWEQQQDYYRNLGANDPAIMAMQQRALGQNSVVALQAQAERDAAANQVAAQMAGAMRGGYNPALARAGMMQQASIGQGMAAQIAAARAAEQQQAQAQWANWIAQRENMAAGMYGLGMDDKAREQGMKANAVAQQYGINTNYANMQNQRDIAQMQIDAQNSFSTKDLINAGINTASGGLGWVAKKWG